MPADAFHCDADLVTAPRSQSLLACVKPLPSAMTTRISRTSALESARGATNIHHTSQTERPTIADMSLSLSPGRAMGQRAVLGTKPSTSPPPSASLFYSGHGHIPHSCSVSVLHLSQSNVTTVEADRPAMRMLPACPPRSSPHAPAKVPASVESTPQRGDHTPTSTPTAPTVMSPPACAIEAPAQPFDDLHEAATGVFTVGGCTVRELPRYALTPTSRRVKTQKDVADAGTTMSDPPSASLGSTGVCRYSGGTSTASPDKTAFEWSSDDEDGFPGTTESDFWASARSSEDRPQQPCVVASYLLSRDGARRPIPHRAV